MTIQQTIPLNRLVQSKSNVRRTERATGLDELIASIAAHGLRQNLNVRPTTAGRYEVVAGGRRLMALKRLAKDGQLAGDVQVPCLVLDETDDATEISLAENAVRRPMHPDDQFEAFRALVDGGTPVEDVAARFGVTPAVVRQRLKLAHVSPALRATYRKGDMSLEQVMALALVDDHVAQEAAWAELPEWNRTPHSIRRVLAKEAVPANDRLAVFVGVDAYLAAGGGILRDLFGEEEEGFLSDSGLLQCLAEAKLGEAVTVVQAEGWKWVRADLGNEYLSGYRRVYPHYGEDSDEPVFAGEDKARAGTRLTVTHDGTLGIERGLVHPDDLKAERRAEKVPAGSPADRPSLPATVVAELTAHRTATLRMEMVRHPAVALAAVVHAMALGTVYPASYGTESSLSIRASACDLGRHVPNPEEGPAHAELADETTRWGDRLPCDPRDLWVWCLAQPQNVLVDLMAYTAALTLNGVKDRHDRPSQPRLAHAGQLADAVALDMTTQWQPTPEGFYSRLSKGMLRTALTEARLSGVADRIGSMGKAAAVQEAAHALSGTGWLPAPLRMTSEAMDASDETVETNDNLAQAA